MHRIDGSTRSASLPAPLPAGSGDASPGYFAHGDAQGGVPPTIVSPDWANAVQEEIASVIEGAGLTLDKANPHQLDAAIDQKIESALGGGTGSTLIRAGSYRGSIAAEGTFQITFDPPFPNACVSRQATVYIASASNARDFWAQIVGDASTDGMTVQIQSDGDDNHSADGFDWLAIGN